MPLGLDLTQRIVNVKWAGEKGAFVATNTQYMYHGAITTAEPPKKGKTVKWSLLDLSQFNFTGGTDYPGTKEVQGFHGLSYGVVGGTETKPQRSVFIVCGDFQGTEDFADTGTVFFVSHDGRSWTKTLVVPTVWFPPDFVLGSEEVNWAARESVWDKNTKAFYIAGPASKSVRTHAGADVFRGEYMYSSPDGESWTRVSENFIADSTPPYEPDRYPSPSAILAHCTKRENEGPLPDGYQAYGPTAGIFMKSGGTFSYVTSVGVRIQPDVIGTRPPSTVTIKRDEGGASSTGTTSNDCWCVAYAESVWSAGLGNGAIDISIDNGKTWETVFHSSFEIAMTNIIGGELVGAEEPTA